MVCPGHSEIIKGEVLRVWAWLLVGDFNYVTASRHHPMRKEADMYAVPHHALVKWIASTIVTLQVFVRRQVQEYDDGVVN